jgi:hypothetical protein
VKHERTGVHEGSVEGSIYITNFRVFLLQTKDNVILNVSELLLGFIILRPNSSVSSSVGNTKHQHLAHEEGQEVQYNSRDSNEGRTTAIFSIGE